ncbi:MAG: hypothetical protein IT293_18345 [Deltaproteobacteria bacterium]|nr:hypothetical protein [Deltaproteobacteria bacterium]
MPVTRRAASEASATATRGMETGREDARRGHPGGAPAHEFAGVRLVAAGSRIALLLLMTAPPVWSASGTLDTSFGPDHTGKVTTLVPGQGTADALLVQANDKIVLGGTNNTNSILVRYDDDGTLDDGFGDGGVLGAALFSAPAGSVRALLELGDHEILGAAGANSFVLARFAADGGSFDQGAASSATTFRAFGLAPLPGQKTLLVGEGGVAGDKCTLARFASNLALDTTFGPGPTPTGVVVTSLGSCRGLVRNGDGTLVVPVNGDGTQAGFGIARFTAGGVLDSEFGTNGVTLAVQNGCTTATGIARQPSGAYIVVGRTGSGSCPLAPLALVAARFTDDGALDQTFGLHDSGFQVVGDPNGELAFTASAVVVDPQGNVIVGGTVAGPEDIDPGIGPSAFFLIRYTVDGEFDLSFGNVVPGLVLTGFGSGTSAELNALALQPDGKLVAAGRVCMTGQCSFALTRYLMSAPVPVATATATGGVGVTATPTRTPTPTAARTPAPEAGSCTDCIDNDFDGAIDRDDSDCVAPANGGGDGLAGDPGTAAFKCQKALGKSAAKLALGRVAALGGCLLKAFTCAQKGGDAGCLGKAAAACGKVEAARQSAVAKLTADVAKLCGDPPVASGDLRLATGLGFAAEEAGCAQFGVASLADAAAVAACIAKRHACNADALVGAEIPRARQLLALAGHDPDVEAPCLPSGGAGGAGTDVKAVLKCQKAFAKSSAAYAAARLKAGQKCVDGVSACVHLKGNEGGCRSKADASCLKLAGKVEAGATKSRGVIAKACSTLGLADLIDPAGMGFGLRAPECVGGSESVDALASCIVGQHACRVDQLLLGQAPRGVEFGAVP